MRLLNVDTSLTRHTAYQRRGLRTSTTWRFNNRILLRLCLLTLNSRRLRYSLFLS